MRKNAPPTGETFFGGGGWIRTTEARRNRFTVCPLWPLGNPSKIALTVEDYSMTVSKKQVFLYILFYIVSFIISSIKNRGS